MALPIVAATAVGTIITALVQFFASKAGAMLAGAGLTFVAIKGFQTIIGFMVADFNAVVGSMSGGGGGGHLGLAMLKFAAYVGLFDGINIVLSGYLAIASIKSMRVVLSRLAS